MAKDINDEVQKQGVGTTPESNNEIEEKLKMLDEKIKMINEKSKELEEKSKELDLKVEAFDKNIKEASVKLPAINEKELTVTAEKIGVELSKMEKVHVRIPLDEKNQEDKFVPVTISGYTYQIARGQSVEVPKEVERILIEAKYI